MAKPVEQRTVDLLKAHNLLKQAVDLDALAEALDISVKYQSLQDGFSAFLLIKDGKPTAFVNSDHHPNRRRFSLAHEIGHFVLHHRQAKQDHLFLDKSLTLYTRKDHHTSENYKMEREANEFAASLLMPQELIEKYVAKHELNIEDEFDVSRLALAFGVSEQALQIRLSHLGLAEPNF